jgi:hypothetical protein
MSIFGPLVTADDVEQAAILTLRKWLPTHLNAAGVRKGLPAGALPYPRDDSYRVTPTLEDEIDILSLPRIIVVSPGTVDDPELSHAGGYSVWWDLRLAAVVHGKDRAQTNFLAKLYAAAMRETLLQHQSLGGAAQAVTWTAEGYDDADGEEQRSRAIGLASFAVLTDSAVDPMAGPTTPDPKPSPETPYPDLPEVREDGAIVTTTPREELG